MSTECIRRVYALGGEVQQLFMVSVHYYFLFISIFKWFNSRDVSSFFVIISKGFTALWGIRNRLIRDFHTLPESEEISTYNIQ